MPFKPEDKVIWNQLSTSLQERFKDLECRAQKNIDMSNENAKNIAINTANIQKNANRIASLRQKADQEINKCLQDLSKIKVPNAGGPTTTLLMSGETGQIAKIDPIRKILFPHDNFQLKMICQNDNWDYIVSVPQIVNNTGDHIGDRNIYNLEANTIFAHNGSSWYQVNDDFDSFLMNRTFLFNPVTYELYFYFFKGKYCKLHVGNDKNDIGVVREAGVNYGTPYIALIGDSLLDIATLDWMNATYGMQCNRDNHWGTLMENIMHCYIFNKGVGGDIMVPRAGMNQYQSIFNRFYSQILTLSSLPKYCIVDGGGNDLGGGASVSHAQILNCFAQIVNECQVRGIIPIIFLAPCGASNTTGFRLENAQNYMASNANVRNYCQQNGVLYLDLYQTELYNATNMINEQYFAPDNVHFNVAGNQIVANYVINFFKTHNLK